MKFGLTDKQYSAIKTCILEFPEVTEVILFGSRAIGNEKPASDIDLMICGSGITNQTAARLFGLLNEEVSVPFQFDLLNANDELTPALREHISKYGVLFFKKD